MRGTNIKMTTKIKISYKDWLDFHKVLEFVELDVFYFFEKITFFYDEHEPDKCKFAIIEVKKFNSLVKLLINNKIPLHYEVV